MYVFRPWDFERGKIVLIFVSTVCKHLGGNFKTTWFDFSVCNFQTILSSVVGVRFVKEKRNLCRIRNYRHLWSKHVESQHSSSNQSDPAICQMTKIEDRRPKTPKVIHWKMSSQSSTFLFFNAKIPTKQPAIAPKACPAFDVFVFCPFNWKFEVRF